MKGTPNYIIANKLKNNQVKFDMGNNCLPKIVCKIAQNVTDFN